MSSHCSVLQGVTASDIRLAPFPHLVVSNALPKAYYDDLARQFPSFETIAGPGKTPSNELFLRSADKVERAADIAPIWQEFFSYHTSGKFFDEMVGLWSDIILQLYPDIEKWFRRPLSDLSLGIRGPGRTDRPENYEQDIQMDCQFGVNSPVSKVSSVRSAHVDSKHKLFASLLYVPRPDDRAGGNLTLYEYKDPSLAYHSGQSVPYDFVERTRLSNMADISLNEVSEVKTITYEANTLVMWLNSPYSVHGVTPRCETHLERRYVNLIGEAYRSGREGFFQLKKKKPSLRHRLFGP